MNRVKGRVHFFSHSWVLFVILVPFVKTQAQQVTLPVGTPLRVALLHRVRIRVGAPVRGRLTQPVYLSDHRVIPAGALVTGTIQSTKPDTRTEHIQRLLAADFSPPRIPVLGFDTLVLPAEGSSPEQRIGIQSTAEQTTARVLTFGKKVKRRSLWRQARDAVRQQTEMLKEAIKDPKNRDIKHRDYGELVEKWAVGQLPVHPLLIWSDARFDADLTQPAEVPDSPHPLFLAEDLHGRLPEGLLHARLVTSLSSGTAVRNDAVDAVITQPLFSADGKSLLVPEGTHLTGKVVQVKAAKSLGRNGSLRFTFTKLLLPNTAPASAPVDIHGQLSAAETAPGAHISVDEEGQAKANDGPAKYIEPALLGVLAAAATPDEHDRLENSGAGVGASTTASNGFGLIARVISLSTRNTGVVQGLAYYALAKSIYYRFIAKGSETKFPHDTEIEFTLSEQ